MADDADRHLLFGLLALQVGLIDQAQLVAAFHAWTRDKARPLADHLRALGHLDDDQRRLVEAVAAQHLKTHGGETDRSLAALPAGRSMRERLAALGDPGIDATLARVGPGSTEPEPEADPDRTTTYAVGAAGADGRRFRILRPHARGGLGAVFVALDAELNREVALKQILDPLADDPTSRQRFLLEAEITGGLEHPGIVPVYGLGAHEGGRPYYAMRFVRGDSLKEAVDRSRAAVPAGDGLGKQPLELRRLLRRFADVCDAVEYAHSRGVLHRDLKPSNIIVGRHGETLVVDWGLAKPMGRSKPGGDAEVGPLVPPSAGASAETLPGSALGTPAYMSPEQARGDLDALGPRSDVYSLGATLYYLLTGRAPFEGGDVGAVLRAVEAGRFPPPRALDPTIDRALEAVCLKAMANRPVDRYATARELADDVERWMADEPVRAFAEPWAARLGRWARRHQPLVAAAAVLLVTATAALGVGAALVDRQRQIAVGARGQAERARLQAEAERTKAETSASMARDAIDKMLAELGDEGLANIPQLEGLRMQMIDEALKRYEALLGLRPEDGALKHDAALAFRRAANLERLLTRDDRARAHYRRALDLLEQLHPRAAGTPRNLDLLAETYRDAGAFLWLIGRPEDAEDWYRRSLDLAVRLRQRSPSSEPYRRTEARALLDLGLNCRRTGRDDEARRHFERMIALLTPLVATPRAIHFDRTELAEAHAVLAVVLRRLGLPEESERAFDRALEVARAAVAAHPGNMDCQYTLADTLVHRGQTLAEAPGRLAESEGPLSEAVAILDGLARDYPRTVFVRRELAGALNARGDALARLDRPEEAGRDRRRAREVAAALVADVPTRPAYQEPLADALAGLGRLALAHGDRPEARRLLEEAADRLRAVVAAYPKDITPRRSLERVRADLARIEPPATSTSPGPPR